MISEEQYDRNYYAMKAAEADLAKLKSDLAEAVRLLTDARDSVEFEVMENELNWGERLMHKQEHAIETLKQIEAFIHKHRSTT